MSKKKEKTFTFQSFIRLTIFIIIFFIAISLLSSHKKTSSLQSDPTLFIGEQEKSFLLSKASEIGNSLYLSIPPSSRYQLENLNQTPAAFFIQEKIALIKEASNGFPQKQIKEIQKMIATSIYENFIRTIDNP